MDAGKLGSDIAKVMPTGKNFDAAKLPDRDFNNIGGNLTNKDITFKEIDSNKGGWRNLEPSGKFSEKDANFTDHGGKLREIDAKYDKTDAIRIKRPGD